MPPLTKKISQPWSETGKTVYNITRKKANSYRLNDADGAFASAPADPYLSMPEDAVIKGLYEVSEARTVWEDGDYEIFVYRQTGATPVPANDMMIGYGVMTIVNDAEKAPGATAAEIKTAMEAAGSSLALILEDTGTTLPGTLSTIAGYLDTEIAAILADTNELQTDWANGGRLDLLIDSIVTALAAIADQVWDEAIGGHLGVGSTGLKLNAASAAGDPWSTELPGAYTGIQAGHLFAHIKEKTDTLGGAGAITWPYTLTDADTGAGIDGAEVWVTTDLEGANVIASGITDDDGVVIFTLDAGIIYVWRKKAGYNFVNPDQETVS